MCSHCLPKTNGTLSVTVERRGALGIPTYPEQRAQIQSELIRLGFLEGEADGEFGPQTRAAIKRYQAQSGAPQSEFLTAEQRQHLLGVAQASGPSPAQAQCQVADPTGTALNIRATPNGDIVGAVNNGVSVRLVQTNQDTRGRLWSLISRVADNQNLGWVYREYVACSPAETPATATQVACLLVVAFQNLRSR